MAQKDTSPSERTTRTYEKLQELAAKARIELEKLIKLVTREADFGSKLVKEKFDILNINSQISRKYHQLGKEVYDLVKKGRLTDPTLVKIVKEIDKMYKDVNKKKKEIDKLKGLIKKEMKKS